MTARALTARPARFFAGAGSTALALALGATPLFMMGTAHAAGTTGKGTITVHNVGTDPHTQANEPKVCSFYLVADGYAATKTSFSYDFEDKTSGALHVAPGVISMTNGFGYSAPITGLTDGHQYKPHGAGPDENGNDNFKVFKIDCSGSSTTGGTTGNPTTGGSGGPTTGDTGNPTTGDTGNPTTGDTGNPTTGDTGNPTTGDTGNPTTGDTGNPTTGDTGNPTTGGGTTGGTTGITGGGGKPVITPPQSTHHTKPVTRGSGHVVVKKTLPFTGVNSSELALWGFASILGGVGFTVLGSRKGKLSL